jgi:SAM-dependent methyltransferase
MNDVNALLLNVMAEVDAKLMEALKTDEVQTGPFTGTHICLKPKWNDGNTGAKLIGSYEFELHDSFEKAISRRPGTVINVGCAEGYYAVGLARRLPNARVYALDIDADSVKLCEETALRNELTVADPPISGSLHAEQCELACDLNRYVGPAPHLYVVDCEGAEYAIMDPDRFPQLRTADLIVEIHNSSAHGREFARRFSNTHSVILFGQRALPDLDRYWFLNGAPLIVKQLLTTDKRPLDISWMVAWAKSRE